ELAAIAHETLGVEIDLAHHQLAEVVGAEGGGKPCLDRVTGQEGGLEDDRDAFVPGLELIAWPHPGRGELAEGQLLAGAHGLGQTVNALETKGQTSHCKYCYDPLQRKLGTRRRRGGTKGHG